MASISRAVSGSSWARSRSVWTRLGIGFSILYIGVPLVYSLVFIGAASVLSTTLGLALGKRMGLVAEERAALWAGIVLVLTGVAFAGLKFFHVGI